MSSFGFVGGGGRGTSRSAGLPFGGIPPELEAGVAKVTADEPPHPLVEVGFSHRALDPRPLSMRRLLAPYRGGIAIAVALVLVETSSLQAGPLLTQIGIDKGISRHDLGVVVAVGLAYIGLVFVSVVSSAARVAWTGRVSQELLYALRRRVFEHQLRLSLEFYTREKAGVIMSRMTADVEILNQFLQDGLVNLLTQGLTMVFVTGVLFFLNARLALVTVFVVVPALLVSTIWFRRASARGFLRVRDGIAAVLSDLQESLSGVRVVTAYNRQTFNIVKHRNIAGDYRKANDHTAFLAAIYGPGTDALGYTAQAIVLLVGGSMVVHHHLTIGDLTAFLLYLTAFFAPIQTLVQFYNNYQQAQAATTKLRLLLLERPAVPESDEAIDVPPLEGEIRFDGVSFGYDPAQQVLHDIDLTIHPGETVAFVGPTGAGKSTIAKLITRFYDPTSGTITIDGHDLRDLTLDSLRRQLGVIPQEPFLFVGTLRENIAFGRPDATDAEIKAAAEAVGLDELLDRLPEGLDAQVHERGVSLSAGERQLIALARAFAAQPRIVVLDEATSNLDLQSETKVERGLDVVLEGRTAIVIAHRLPTAMRADRIVVIERGRIVEAGSHAELVARRGSYEKLWRAWQEHAEPAAA